MSKDMLPEVTFASTLAAWKRRVRVVAAAGQAKVNMSKDKKDMKRQWKNYLSSLFNFSKKKSLSEKYIHVKPILTVSCAFVSTFILFVLITK